MTTADTSGDLSGIDFSNYKSWPTITTPSGGTYHIVPGTAYVYDPFLSQAKGRPVLFRNPKPQQDAQKKQEDAAKKAASPLGQAAPILGGVAGTVGANQLISRLSPATVSSAVNTPNGVAVVMSDGTIKGAGAAANAFTTAATSSGIPAGAIGTAANGGYLMADGTIQAANSVANSAAPTIMSASKLGADGLPVTTGPGVGAYLGIPGAIYSGYQLSEAIDANDPKSAGLSGAGLGLSLGAMAPLAGFGPLGWGALGLMTLAGGAGGLGLQQLLGSESTKEIESGRWKGVGKDDLAQSMGMGGYDYFAGTGGEKSRDESFLTVDAIRNNPDNYNNIPDWDTWSKDNQDKFLSTMLNEKKVREKKGGIYYDDARAKQLADQIRSGGPTPSTPGTPETPTNGVPEVINKRSKTSSPGIGLDGKRVGTQLAERINNRGR